MLMIKAWHVIFMVAWFAGLFYLPRLFVYHADAKDDISNTRFKIMERRLFYGIMTPAGVLTSAFGIYLLSYNWAGYFKAGWVHAKLGFVVLLIAYHVYCGFLVRDFKHDRNRHSATFYRWFNEFPTIILISVIILAEVKPF